MVPPHWAHQTCCTIFCIPLGRSLHWTCFSFNLFYVGPLCHRLRAWLTGLVLVPEALSNSFAVKLRSMDDHTPVTWLSEWPALTGEIISSPYINGKTTDRQLTIANFLSFHFLMNFLKYSLAFFSAQESKLMPFCNTKCKEIWQRCRSHTRFKNQRQQETWIL